MEVLKCREVGGNNDHGGRCGSTRITTARKRGAVALLVLREGKQCRCGGHLFV